MRDFPSKNMSTSV